MKSRHLLACADYLLCPVGLTVESRIKERVVGYMDENIVAMEGKIEITICLGSSCFARGNKEIVNLIKLYLHENKLEDMVYFHGAHCFGNCAEGPVIKINEVTYKRVTPVMLPGILQSVFNR